jgi:hypothetical protein
VIELGVWRGKGWDNISSIQLSPGKDQQRLADTRTAQLQASTDPGRQLPSLAAVEVLEVDHLHPLAETEMDGLAGRHEQLLEEGRRGLAQIEPVRNQRAELERLGVKPVTAARSLQLSEPHEVRRQSVYGGFRQPGEHAVLRGDTGHRWD